MGLDMNLSRRSYISNDEKTKLKLSVAKTASKYTQDTIQSIDTTKVKYIIEEVGYWRKANHIHKWFVDNVQKGNDDCAAYYVSEENLKKLRDTCQKVLDSTSLVKGEVTNGIRFENGKSTPIIEDGELLGDDSVARKLLPTNDGFFFGGTEYDQWYWRDLQETVKIIDEALKHGGDFEYQSSW